MDTRAIGYLVGMFACFPILLVLIIGSIYYWIKGRSIPFRQAVLNWRVILLSAILFLMSLASRVGSYVQQESSHVYPEREVKGFTTSCVESAGSGPGSAIAERVCSCAIIDIQKAYTYGEFKNLVTEMGKSNVVPSDLKAIMTSCAKKQSQ
jgi:hypothetical protein